MKIIDVECIAYDKYMYNVIVNSCIQIDLQKLSRHTKYICNLLHNFFVNKIFIHFRLTV